MKKASVNWVRYEGLRVADPSEVRDPADIIKELIIDSVRGGSVRCRCGFTLENPRVAPSVLCGSSCVPSVPSW